MTATRSRTVLPIPTAMVWSRYRTPLGEIETVRGTLHVCTTRQDSGQLRQLGCLPRLNTVRLTTREKA